MSTIRGFGCDGLLEMLGELRQLKANVHFFRGVTQSDDYLTVHLRRKCLPCGGEIFQMEVVVAQQPDRIRQMTLRSGGGAADLSIYHYGLIAALGKFKLVLKISLRKLDWFLKEGFYNFRRSALCGGATSRNHPTD